MSWRRYLLLALLGLAAVGMVAIFERVPGYMDADYYYAGALQLAHGRGLMEPYLWNYLDDPAGLPHPAFSYWMPLASLMAAAGAVVFGPESWFAARIGFLAVAAAIPPLAAALAWSLSSRKDLAMTSGLLAAFPCFYLPFLPTTDTFGLYILLGGAFFLILGRRGSPQAAFLLGLVSGLMHLARADGLLWLGMAAAAALVRGGPRSRWRPRLAALLAVVGGYLLIMAPWYLRNLAAFGSPLAPGASRTLWLTSYDQLFAYPASQLTFRAWLDSGLAAILRVRTWALGLNLASLLSVQGEVFLFPLVMVGAWHLRGDHRVRAAAISWLLLFAAMTVLFPLAGARGGYFHAGAAHQVIWWALAPIGLERLVSWLGRRRGWNVAQGLAFLQTSTVGMAALLSALICYGRLRDLDGGQPWGRERASYVRVAEFLRDRRMAAGDVVIVANPPGFALASGNPSIAVPDGGFDAPAAVARRYGASYLILEKGSIPAALLPLYENPIGQADWLYLGGVDGARVFRFRQP